MTEDLDELLKLAAEVHASGENVEMNEVERYVVATGITEGKTAITPYHLWHSYCGWAPKPMPQRVFWTHFKKMFKQHRVHHRRYYLLNPEPFDLSLDTYFKLRRDLRIQREKRRERKKEQQA